MTGNGRATPITTPHHSSAFTTLHDGPTACGRPGRQAIGPLANDPDIPELEDWSAARVGASALERGAHRRCS